jgi:ABC-type Fe3+-hydroxamate transport system substrate-binding protein
LNSPADDLGTVVPACRPVRRVVSLVPSLTEAVASVDATAIVGATTWCSRPADLNTVRVRGTKNPDVAAIIGLAPDLVLANKEENRRKDVETLRSAGVPVWVTDIQTLDGAFTSLQRLFTDALGWRTPQWLAQAHREWNPAPPAARRRAVIPIWRDPWMAVGSRTFTGDLADRLGLDNCFANSPERYPHTSIDEITAARPDVIVLPDEPYRFHAGDGPEAFPDIPTVLVEGRLLTWYGPSLVAARAALLAAISAPDHQVPRVGAGRIPSRMIDKLRFH